MEVVFSKKAWEDYISWLDVDRKMLKKINSLIKEILHSPFIGTGKPEQLKYDLAGLWSRRIDKEHRLVYQVIDKKLIIIACKYHYE